MKDLSRKSKWKITINDGYHDFTEEFELSGNLSVWILFQLIRKHLEALDFAEAAFRCRDFDHLIE